MGIECGQGRFNLMCGLKLGRHVWPISPPSCPLILFIISVFFRNLLFTGKKGSIGLGPGLTLVLPGAPTSPSVHTKLIGAINGLDGFNGTLAWGYTSHKECQRGTKRTKGALQGLPMVQESPRKIFFSH